ncbi:MAG: glutathione S-transferase family protein [Pseudomonadota bacterium]
MPDLRIFSYLPNPRLSKAVIAAHYSGANIEIVGDAPRELTQWLWDFDARKLTEADKPGLAHFARTGSLGFAGLTLYKSDAFLRAHPLGSVPAGFSGDGSVGIFESNAIMRAAARSGSKNHGLLGQGPLGESRVDAFLDRSLVFACDTQRYLLAADELTEHLYNDMARSLVSYTTGLDSSLQYSEFIVGDEITLADIAAVCELSLFTNEARMTEQLSAISKQALAPQLSSCAALGEYLQRMAQIDSFHKELGEYLEKLLVHWTA